MSPPPRRHGSDDRGDEENFPILTDRLDLPPLDFDTTIPIVPGNPDDEIEEEVIVPVKPEPPPAVVPPLPGPVVRTPAPAPLAPAPSPAAVQPPSAVAPATASTAAPPVASPAAAPAAHQAAPAPVPAPAPAPSSGPAPAGPAAPREPSRVMARDALVRQLAADMAREAAERARFELVPQVERLVFEFSERAQASFEAALREGLEALLRDIDTGRGGGRGGA